MSDDKPTHAQATNPATGEALEKHKLLTEEEINNKIQQSWDCFTKYRKSNPKERSQKLAKLGDILEKGIEKYAKTITTEMGKPIKEARKEVTYAVKECRYFAEHLEEFLKTATVKTDAKKSFVVYQPLGVIYHVTPFNFPFWLIFRGTAAALAMGNTVVNKNPVTCPQTGINAEEAFKEAGFTNGEFINLIVGQHHSELIISNDSIRGVSFTGSTDGGKKVAEFAGKHCKKTVMELGGNDPFIVLKDADMELALEQAIQGRLYNGGQCCTAAKRFIVDQSIYEEFKGKLVEKVKEVKVGDPMEEDTQVGPLAKKSGCEKILEQVKKAKEKGGNLLYGGERLEEGKLKNGYYVSPAVFEIGEENPLFLEETFGGVFLLMKFKDEEDAVRIANKSQYGLGGAVFSKDEERAVEIGKELDVGAVYINNMVDWKVELPEGGVKESGFGREGGRDGAMEFVNVKSVYIK